jgi:membrane peptidoglycan carboxypeptidase
MKKIQFIYKLFLFFMICFIVLISSLYAYAYFSPKITLNSANAIYIYDYKGNLVWQENDNKKWVNSSDIADDLKKATISVEDKNFYYHHGFDYLRIIKSLYLNAKNHEIMAGASTISQQYVKNLYLDFDQTWERKMEEALLTLKLEVHYSKKQILEGYLNTINYGQGNYGIENASEYYFNKKAKDLSLEEAIILAGIPKSPENYNPVSNYDASIKRAKIVAKSMVKNNYLTKEEYQKLFKKKIEIYGKRETNNMKIVMYYYDAVLKELQNIDDVPKTLIKSGGLKIYTNLNFDLEKKLDEEITKNITDTDTQTASIITEPSTGKVLALAGGKDYAVSQYNRIMQAKRQVGSTIKPFLYYAALNNNMTEASTFKSEVTNFVFADNQSYSPKNYDNTYANKDITMAAALAYSDNIYAVKTHLFLGEEQLVSTLKLAGLKQNLKPMPSLALGAQEINLYDYAEAYNTLANYGNYNDLYFIAKIKDANGNTIYKHQDKVKPVLDKDYTFIINEMLTNTYNSTFIDYLSPTIIYLNSKISRKYAIKSGTTDNDYWLVGYNPDVFMMVWAGNDLNNKIDSSYSRKIKDVWCNTVEDYLKDKPDNWYEIPNDVVGIPLNAIDGTVNKSKNTTIFYFKKGSEPQN